MSKPQTFPLFPLLPYELRFAIWQYALSGPVTVSFSSGNNPSISKITRLKLTGEVICTPNHTHIGASCQEAWDIMVTTHEPAKLLTILSHSATSSHSATMEAWIDFPNTSFHLGIGAQAQEAIYILSNGPNRLKIEKLLLQFSSYREALETLRRIDAFTELKEVRIVAPPPSLEPAALYDENLFESIERFMKRTFGRMGKSCPKIEVERFLWEKGRLGYGHSHGRSWVESMSTAS